MSRSDSLSSPPPLPLAPSGLLTDQGAIATRPAIAGLLGRGTKQIVDARPSLGVSIPAMSPPQTPRHGLAMGSFELFGNSDDAAPSPLAQAAGQAETPTARPSVLSIDNDGLLGLGSVAGRRSHIPNVASDSSLSAMDRQRTGSGYRESAIRRGSVVIPSRSARRPSVRQSIAGR